MTEIDSQLEAVTNDTPHLDTMIGKAEDRLAMVRRQLDEVKTSIISLQTTNQRISELRDFNSRRAMVKGRLSLYLENMPAKDVDDSDDKLEAEKLAEQIRAIEVLLDDETLAGRIESILSLVSAQITSLARKLEIEHSDSPMRLDLKKLTIVADHADDGPIPMPKMGSGETWVGLHLVTHLALHNWFFKKQRPVPQFLFLDPAISGVFSARYIGRNSSRADRSNESRPAIGNPYVQVDCRGNQEFPGDRYRARRHQGGLVSGIGP